MKNLVSERHLNYKEIYFLLDHQKNIVIYYILKTFVLRFVTAFIVYYLKYI